MAIEELEKRIEKEEMERRKRYPLLDVVTNRAEIREISEDTLKYMSELYPEIESMPAHLWEVVPRITIEMLKEVFNYLSGMKSTDNGEVSYTLGNFLKIGIEYGTTEDADKDGTFNPVISVLSEMAYDNNVDTNNKLSHEIPIFTDTTTLQDICTKVTNTLKTKYGIVITQWTAVQDIFAAFMRIARQYLIKHRDDTEYGVEINLADVVDMSIERYTGDNGDEYCIQIAPGQIAKLQFSKNDEVTENVVNS